MCSRFDVGGASTAAMVDRPMHPRTCRAQFLFLGRDVNLSQRFRRPGVHDVAATRPKCIEQAESPESARVKHSRTARHCGTTHRWSVCTKTSIRLRPRRSVTGQRLSRSHCRRCRPRRPRPVTSRPINRFMVEAFKSSSGYSRRPLACGLEMVYCPYSATQFCYDLK